MCYSFRIIFFTFQDFIPEIDRRRKEWKLPETERALLLMDGHKAHDNDEVRQLLAQHHIDVEFFLPHATHLMQPLDVVLFRILKAELRKVFSFFQFFPF